jgi:polyisoprenoid-binding protein YceI
MKTLKFLSSISLLVVFLTLTKCSEDDTAPIALSELSGKVTYTNASGTSANAIGAIVVLEDVATSTSVSTVANGTGDFSFDNLIAGDYKLSSIYYTDNKNVSGRLDGLNFSTAEDVAVTIESSNVTKDLSLVSVGQSGTAIEALAADYSWNAETSLFTNVGAWTFDNAHSPTIFQFAYRGVEADFSGSFGQTNKFKVNMDPANLATASIEVEVDLASVNTRTPGGRDNRTTIADNPTFSPLTMFTELGCIASTFGVTADNAPPTEIAPQMITADPDRYAKFSSHNSTSTNITKYGDGYLAKGNLVFFGQSKPVELYFKIVPAWVDTTPDPDRKYSGFEGKFVFNAKNLFGVTSSSLNAADIRIYVSTVLYKVQ